MHFAFCLYKHFPYSGLSRDMLRITRECRKRNHKVTIYAGSWEGEYPEGVEVVILNHYAFTNHTRAAAFHRKLRKALVGKQYDVLVGFNKIPGVDAYYSGDYCYVGRSHLRHSFFYRFTPRFQYLSRFEKGVFAACQKTKILSLSNREKSIYQRYYLTPDSRFECLPPTLEKERWEKLGKLPARDKIRSSLKITKTQKLVLLIGSGFSTKGLDRAILAIASLPEKLKKKTRLLVVGQDKIESYQRMVRKHGVQNNVRFLGGREDIPELMKAGDILLHPAYAETTGTVLLEAIISGLPVLATPVCGYAHHIKLADAGHVLRSRYSQDELNEKLAEMLISPDIKQWSENGINYGKGADLYLMPERSVDALEKIAKTDPKPCEIDNNDEQLFVNNVLRKALGGNDSFDDLMSITGKVYREALGRQTLRFTQGDRDYFLKMHTGVGWAEIIKNLSYLRAPVVGALNEWHGVHRLFDLDIDTMTVAAYGMRGRNPAKRHSFIITEALPTSTSLEDFCGSWRHSPPKKPTELRFKRWIMSKVAETARVMHENGANHRDFYLCHFLLDAKKRGDNYISEGSKLYLIDLHRMQLRRKTPSRWIVKDIAGLYYSSMDIGLTQRDIFRFMKMYRGKPLREILNNESSFWMRVMRRGQNLYRSEQRKALARMAVEQKKQKRSEVIIGK